MSQWIYLSHVLSPETPGFGGKAGFQSRTRRSIAEGASTNEQEWDFSNHTGTHIDVPFHFFENGKKLDQYAASEWISDRPVLIDYAAQPGELIGIEAVAKLEKIIPQDADCVIIRTGFEKFRSEKLYWENNPGISAELGLWLRQNRRQVKFIGFDFISLTAFQKRPEGRAAHLAFLDPNGQGQPICIVEDMNLATIQGTLKGVIVCPLRVAGADGGPATVLGVTAEK